MLFNFYIIKFVLVFFFFYRKLPDKVKCTSDYIAKICGEDAGKVSEVAVAPFMIYRFSGCIPAFE